MADFNESFRKIDRDFANKGIPTDKPGFYDHPAFVRIEKSNPDYLNNYARFVQKQIYSREYLEASRSVILKTSEILHEELKRDGRLGACVDVSMVLSRILDEEGIWNFSVKGALSIYSTDNNAALPIHFWPYDTKEIAAGHAWVFAPPFSIVDITLKYQPYDEEVKKLIPDYILIEKGTISEARPEEIFSNTYRLMLPPLNRNTIKKYEPKLAKFSEVFPTIQIKKDDLIFRYTPCGIGASDKPLSNITSLQLNGRHGIDIYKEIIIPQLR